MITEADSPGTTANAATVHEVVAAGQKAHSIREQEPHQFRDLLRTAPSPARMRSSQSIFGIIINDIDQWSLGLVGTPCDGCRSRS